VEFLGPGPDPLSFALISRLQTSNIKAIPEEFAAIPRGGDLVNRAAAADFDRHSNRAKDRSTHAAFQAAVSAGRAREVPVC
jgi:hypothetical protein